MKRPDFGGVKVMVAMENPIVRQGLQNVLGAAGFPRATEVGTHDRMISNLVEARYDVILASTELGSEPLSPFLIQLRQGALVHHPMPIIITFLSSSEQDDVRRAIDAGPDDLLQMPVVPGQMLQRLAGFVEKRKTWVVTSDYVGPDRRQGIRPGAMVVPTIDVPNPMAMRIGKLPDDTIKDRLTVAGERLKAMRLARYAFELQWLLRAIRGLFDQESTDKDKLISFCERIKTLLYGLPRLLPNGMTDDISAMVERLEMGTNILIKSGLAADQKILQGHSSLIIYLVRALQQLLPADLGETVGLAPAS